MMVPANVGAPAHESDPRLNRMYGVRRLVQDRRESTPPQSNRGEAREFKSLTCTESDRLLVLPGKRTDENDPLSNNLTVRDIDGCVSPKGTGVAVPIHTAVRDTSATVHAVPPNLLHRPPLCGGAGAFLSITSTK